MAKRAKPRTLGREKMSLRGTALCVSRLPHARVGGKRVRETGHAGGGSSREVLAAAAHGSVTGPAEPVPNRTWATSSGTAKSASPRRRAVTAYSAVDREVAAIDVGEGGAPG